jgi:hypothetical protein
MAADQQKRYAEVAHLAMRIHLNTQAILLQLSRQISSGGKTGRGLVNEDQLRRSLEDLGSCLTEFESLTGIDMFSARSMVEKSFNDLDKKDISSLYENIQKFYRDGYLGTLLSISRNES